MRATKSLAVRVITFLFGNFAPNFQPHPLHLELEMILNQMAAQGYFLLSTPIKSGKKGAAETILLIFAKNVPKPDGHTPSNPNWGALKTRQITDFDN